MMYFDDMLTKYGFNNGQIVPDAVRVEPIDWTRPVEGWVLFAPVTP